MKAQTIFPGFAIAAAFPSIILIDTAYAVSRGWSFVSRSSKLEFFLVLLVGLSSVIGLVFERGRNFYRERWPQLLLLVISLACTWAFVEIALRVLRIGEDRDARFHGRPPGLERTFHPDPMIVMGVEPRARFTTNSLGFRGPEMPTDRSVRRILCVGGSTTECLYLDDNRAWPQQLMDRLNEAAPARPVWVGNMGYAGYSSTMHQRFVEESDLMREVDFVVILVGINDLTKSLIRMPTRQETLQDDYKAPLWYQSKVARLVRLASRRQMQRVFELEQDSSGAYMANLRARRRKALHDDRLPNIERALQAYASCIRSIIGASREKGVRPLFLTQPVLWSDHLSSAAIDSLWLGWTHDGRFLTAKVLRQGIDQFNNVLLRECHDLGADCLDLTTMSGRADYFYDDCHFTDAGASEVANRIAEWFLQ